MGIIIRKMAQTEGGSDGASNRASYDSCAHNPKQLDERFTMPQHSTCTDHDNLDPVMNNETTRDTGDLQLASMQRDNYDLHTICHSNLQEINNLKEMITQLFQVVNHGFQSLQSPEPQHKVSKQAGLLSSIWKCSDCEKLLQQNTFLAQQVTEQNATIERLASQVNAEVRKMQGHRQSNQAVEQEFMKFFSNGPVDDILTHYAQPNDVTEKRLLEEKLCEIFQHIFDKVQGLLLAQIKTGLGEALFKADQYQSVNDPQFNNFLRAYSRLLPALELTDESKTIAQLRDSVKVSNVESLPAEWNSEFKDDCIKLSWKLLTAVPPLLAQCPKDKKFDPKKHSVVNSGSGRNPSPRQPLHYLRPHLTSCIAHKTCVKASILSSEQ